MSYQAPRQPTSGWAPRPGYRRGAPGLTHLDAHQAQPAPTGSDAAAWAQPHVLRRQRLATTIRWILALTGAVGLFGLIIWLGMSTTGPVGILVPILLALVPLGIVLATVMWIDRWEPEPFSALLTAFLWGAGVATVISLLVNTTTAVVIAGATGTADGAEMVSAVLSAPLIEELTKGLGVLALYLLHRRSFNGAVDGLVYAAVVAAGFAFGENIVYFVRYADQIEWVFFVRGIASPFAHVTFTAATGLAIGASARMRSRTAWVWMTPVGLSGAIVMHAFWNGVLASVPALYLLVEIPVFVVCIALVVWLRHNERTTMRHRLADYARAGWFAPAEITMITTGSGRRAARRWARQRGPEATRAMSTFLTTSVELANLRQRAVDGHADPDYQATERRLLQAVRTSKQVFLAPAGGTR